ncbi:MAG: strawberry notch family protein, partial [Pseudomonadota bacterium]
MVLRLAFPARAYAKHGTSVETGLLVVDRGMADAAMPAVIAAETLADAAKAAAAVVARPTAQARQFRSLDRVALLVPKARALATSSGRLAFLANTAAVAYETCPWSGEGHDVGLYQAYTLGRIRFAASTPHPSPLVESGPMASVAPPAPTYRPVLPPDIAARISDAQMETVIYAGEAHAQVLPGSWILGEAAHQLVLVADDHAGAVRFRKGFFLGDGTGCGKGREIAGVIADNIAQGRTRAVWLSKNDALLEDARRDWAAIGGTAADLTPQSAWKQADAIRMDKGILYTTYATLRQPARGDRPSRLDQIVTWLGADFNGAGLVHVEGPVG